jgi:hypothetical protein
VERHEELELIGSAADLQGARRRPHLPVGQLHEPDGEPAAHEIGGDVALDLRRLLHRQGRRRGRRLGERRRAEEKERGKGGEARHGGVS